MNENMRKIISESIKVHRQMSDELLNSGQEKLAAIAEEIIKSLKQDGIIYICGNGGSAADAQHVAGELIGRFRRERKGLPAIALTTNTSILTSISNDYSFQKVFVRQVEALVREKDILWAFSTSGSSANIIAAVKLAKEKGARVIAFTGRKGSELERVSDVCFCAENELTPRNQEIHQLAYHIICDLVELHFSQS